VNFTAYSVATTNGGVNVVLNNKDPATSAVVTITLPQAATSATRTTLADPAGLEDISGTGININGAQIAASPTWQPPTPTSLPVKADGSVVLTVGPASAVVLSTH
jgi:hypothetical protein